MSFINRLMRISDATASGITSKDLADFIDDNGFNSEYDSKGDDEKNSTHGRVCENIREWFDPQPDRVVVGQFMNGLGGIQDLYGYDLTEDQVLEYSFHMRDIDLAIALSKMLLARAHASSHNAIDIKAKTSEGAGDSSPKTDDNKD